MSHKAEYLISVQKGDEVIGYFKNSLGTLTNNEKEAKSYPKVGNSNCYIGFGETRLDRIFGEPGDISNFDDALFASVKEKFYKEFKRSDLKIKIENTKS